MADTDQQGGNWINLKVTSEADAFKLIEKALNKELGYQPYRLCFENWPVLSIKLEGEGYESTITPDMAAALVELQHAMNRTYARLVHQSANARVLSIEERDSLKFKAKVEKGSSLVEVNLGEWAEKLSTALVDKMSPEQVVLSVVGVAAVAGGTLAYKWYLRHKSEDKKVEADMQARVALSAEETKRHEILTKALTARPEIDHARQYFDAARTDVLKGVADADTVTVAGVKLDNATAHAVARAKRSESKEIQANGNYQILRVDWHQEGEARFKVLNVDTHREFMASLIDESLEHEQIKLLQQAEWERSQIYLSINATELRGEITTATIVGVTPHAGT